MVRYVTLSLGNQRLQKFIDDSWQLECWRLPRRKESNFSVASSDFLQRMTSLGKSLPLSYTLTTWYGPATPCDTVHLRWDVIMPLRCIKIASDALQCIFQHVGSLAPDFGISQLIIIRFSSVFYQKCWRFNELSFDMYMKSVRYIYLKAIAALKIAGQNGNLPS